LPAPPPKPDFSPPPEKGQTWRTTFGAERVPEEKVEIKGAMTIDADIVLLQGVKDVPAVRRLFPAWHWRLIISRRALTARARKGEAAIEAAPQVPLTAIAVRARGGLRITARDELRELHDIEADLGVEQSAATAARIAHGARSLWFLSVVLPEACAGESSVCPARGYLSSWRQRKRDTGEGTVAGGRLMTAASRALPPAPCPNQEIEADGKDDGEPPLGATGTPREPSGCVAVLDFEP
jgi:hypothetical protein